MVPTHWQVRSAEEKPSSASFKGKVQGLDLMRKERKTLSAEVAEVAEICGKNKSVHEPWRRKCKFMLVC